MQGLCAEWDLVLFHRSKSSLITILASHFSTRYIDMLFIMLII